MVKKSFIAGLTAIILSLCCGLCFAAENNNETSINLGNEITKSVDKTGQSMQNLTDNVFSGNMVNGVRNGANNMRTDVANGMNNVGNGIVNMTGTNDGDNNMNNNGTNNGYNNMDNNTNNDMGINDRDNAGNYNATRTTADATTNGISTMSTTTWMWIILAVAAIIIIAAIWYYATQNND